MPHQCTNCGKTFPDGSKEMLSGCPECGGNKFQFRPASSTPDDAASARRSDSDDVAGTPDAAARTETDSSAAPSAGPSDADVNADPDVAPADSTDPDAGTVDADTPTDSSPASGSDAEAAENAETAPGSPAEADPDADSPAESSADDGENTAQASARRDVVDPDELASAVEREARDTPPRDADGQVIEPQSDDRPGLDELREELNEQFESIKIVNPGQYELNLMELYDRDEYIISLQEDGRYVIEVPDTWRDDTPDDA